MEITAVDVESMTPRDCYEYARSLGLGRRWRQHTDRAHVELRAMGSHLVPLLLQAIAWESGRRKRSLLVWAVFAAAVTIATIPLPLLAPGLWHHDAVQVIVNIIRGGVSMGAGYWFFPTRFSRQSAGLLQECGDARVLGPLLEVLDFLPGVARSRTCKSITRILDGITVADAVQVDERARMGLLNIVQAGSRLAPHYDGCQRDLVLSAIRALGAVGEARALPTIKRIAEDESLLGAGMLERNAALDTLPLLERAAEVKQVSSKLLRPTDSPASADALVRPASASGGDSAALLVRPAVSGDIRD